MEKVGKGEGNRTVVAKNVSLFPPHRAALVALARRDGHGNTSRIVQELVTERAAQVFGETWVEVVSAEPEAA